MKKNLSKTIILISLFASVSFSQIRPYRTLENRITVEVYLATLDNFLYDLTKQPTSKGYIVIHNLEEEDIQPRAKKGLAFEQIAKGHILARKDYFKKNGLDVISRLNIVRGKDKPDFQINFWIIPNKNSYLPFKKTKWDLEISPTQKPRIFFSTNNSYSVFLNDPEHLNLNLFSEYLKENPESYGAFMIHAYSKSQYYKERNKILNLLQKKYAVRRNRLKFFFGWVNKNKIQKRYYDLYPGVEVWFLPSLKIPKDTESFIFPSNWNEFKSYEYPNLGVLAQYLKANSLSRGKFIIEAVSKKQFNREKYRIQNVIVKKYKVDIRRLKFAPVWIDKNKLDEYEKTLYPKIKIWFLPK